jgi:hypothetical protein
MFHTKPDVGVESLSFWYAEQDKAVPTEAMEQVLGASVSALSPWYLAKSCTMDVQVMTIRHEERHGIT